MVKCQLRILTLAFITVSMFSACSQKGEALVSDTAVEETTQVDVAAEGTAEERENTETTGVFKQDEDYSNLAFSMSRQYEKSGYVYCSGDWYYGVGWVDGKSCYQKVRSDGTDRTLIGTNVSPTKVMEFDGKLYSCAVDRDTLQSNLYVSNVSGDNLHSIIESVDNFQIFNGAIYYTWTGDSEKHALYKSDLDGNNSELVLDGGVYYFYLFDNNLVYQDDPDGEKIKIIDADSKNVLIQCDGPGHSPILDGKYLYYVKETNEVDDYGQLCRVDVQTLDEIVLAQNAKWNIQYDSGDIYFVNGNDGDRIYRVNTDGQNLELVTQDRDAEDFITLGGVLFYAVANAQNNGIDHAYWADLDGSNKIDVLQNYSGWSK